MTTLITIPDTTALHLPAKGVPPVTLAKGELALILLPAAESKTGGTLSLSVGSSTFVLAPNSPVQRTGSNAEHPSFVFTPAPVGGRSIGQVRIDVADRCDAEVLSCPNSSVSPEAWESTNKACAALEAELKAHGVWESKTLFVDDEYETGGIVTGPKAGWGESIASAVLGGANSLVGKLTGRTAPEPTLPTTQPVGNRQEAPQDLWNQASIAAKGVGSAAYAVGSTLGQQALHKVEEYNPKAPPVPHKDAPAPPAKEGEIPATAPPLPAKESAAVEPTTVGGSATAAALDAPAAPSAAHVLENEAEAKAEAVKPAAESAAVDAPAVSEPAVAAAPATATPAEPVTVKEDAKDEAK